MCSEIKKRYFVLLLITSIIVFLLFCGTGAAAGGPVHNISGINYSTIQAAINAASDGDTIYVDSGMYQENVVVNKTGLIFIGNDTGAGMPVVDAMQADHAFNITADGVTLDWFNVTNATGSGMSGFFLNSNNTKILNNTANLNRYGIYLDSSSNNTLTNNNANDNTDTGIRMISSGDNTLNNNNASSNAATDIYLYDSSNNTLTGNIVRGSGGLGIHIESSSNNTLISNIASNNMATGILLDSSSNSMLTSNTVTNNAQHGIYLQASSNSNVAGNAVNLNTLNGIRLSSSSNNNTLVNNTVNDNSDIGIYVISSDDNTLNNNNASSNDAATGIHLSSSSNNTLISNIADSNDIHGIYLASSSNNNTLASNIANSNTIYGIFLDSSSNNTLYQNILYNNTNENAYDDDTNNWNSTNLGNYYGDIVAINIGENGINDTEYSINGSSNKDYYPLIVTSNATSPATISGTSTLSFTVSTTLFDYASVGIDNITLYYSTDNATWIKYANSTTGTFTFTASSSGTYYFRTVATDTYGMVENVSLIYDSSTTVSISTPTTPVVSSGGGGDGGGTSGEEYNNIELKDVVREYINMGEETSYNFKEENNAIDVIKFTALKNAGEISATVEVLKGTSAMVKSTPSGKVYKNMNIWVGKSGFATSNNIEDLSIGFKVEKSWIEDNGIASSSIKLLRYYNDKWTSLSTSKSSEDNKYIFFEAKTPGFSPFAITAEETEDLMGLNIPITQMPKVFDEEKPTTQADVGSDLEVEKEEASGLPGFSIIMGLLGIVSAIQVVRK